MWSRKSPFAITPSRKWALRRQKSRRCGARLWSLRAAPAIWLSARKRRYCRNAGQPCHPALRCGVAGLHRLLSHLPALSRARVVIARCGHGGGSGQRNWRAGGMPCHCRSHQRGLWRQFRGAFRAALHAQFLRKRVQRRQYRQRLWCRFPGQPLNQMEGIQ